MLDFVPLTAGNFSEFEHHIMASEEVFPENIRESAESYLEALQQEGSLGLVARLDSFYVGNVVGFSPDAEQCELLRLDRSHIAAADLLYLFNIVTLPAYQGRGFGRELLRRFLAQARAAGFRKVGGHFRGNGSLKNFKTLGGEELGCFEDWFGTGERYTYGELSLCPPPGGLEPCVAQGERSATGHGEKGGIAFRLESAPCAPASLR
jgi:ribosomal protein S18 acetylase RimI-like enzyme